MVPISDHLNIGGGQFFSSTPFYRVNVRKTHCREPLKRINCRVRDGSTCFAEIAAGWSELFSDITAGCDKGKIAVGWSEKSSADTSIITFYME